MRGSASLLAAAALCCTTAAKTCQDYSIPLTITSTDFVFDLPPFETDFDVVDFISNFTSRTAPPATSSPLSSQKTNTASYTIAGTFCAPDSKDPSAHKSTVLIATHGLNFDRYYWDPSIQPEKYSFVDYAIAQGYSIFFYDRLGVGKSSQVSGYVAQLSSETAVLQELTHAIKAGSYTGSIGTPSSVILVGHSFGSAISTNAIGAEPTLADAVILTGFSLNATYGNTNGFLQAVQPRIAAKQHPAKWRQLDTGYLTPVDIYSNVNNFFKAPDYDVKVAKYADDNKQPFAITEYLTVGLLAQLPVAYEGAALIISGQRDFIFCTGDCDGALEVAGREAFANAKPFNTISYPGAGHGLNFHLNAAGAYKDIFDFIASSGL